MNDEQRVARQQAHIEELEVTLARTVAERDGARNLAEQAALELGQAHMRIRELESEAKEVARQLGYTKGTLDLVKQEEAGKAEVLRELCICDTNPATTDGPDRECPLHGETRWRPATMRATLQSVPQLLGALEDLLVSYGGVPADHMHRIQAWANNMSARLARRAREERNSDG